MTSALSGNNFCVVGTDAPVGPASAHQQVLLDRFGQLRKRGNRVPPGGDNFIEENSDNVGGVSIILIETSESERGRG